MGFEVIESQEKWNRIVEEFKWADIYYTYEYCSSSARLERGQAKLFYYSTHLGSIIYPVIVREIKSEYEMNLFDITTPYGYGGPLVNGNTTILKDFRVEFCSYCKYSNIISEIITFHPLFNNAAEMHGYCEMQYVRKTTAVNLTNDLQIIRSQYTKMNKRNIKKALENGLFCKEVMKSSKNITSFVKLYKETMIRKNAIDFYYFDFDFIEMQLKNTEFSSSHLLFVYDYDKVIAAAILFTTPHFSHYHLGASQSKYLYLKPNNLLFDSMIELSKSKGCTHLHLGGGYEEDDSLFKYKSSFTNNNNYEYYIGKKVFNHQVYHFLVEEKKKYFALKKNFFPEYRAIV